MNERGEVQSNTDYFGPKSGKVKRSEDDSKRFRPSDKQNRITEGLPAIPGSFPYQATLIKRGAGPYCGGTIVSGFWIITAAHCTSSDAGGTRYSGNIQVGVGSTRPENTKRHDIAAIIEHPGIRFFFSNFLNTFLSKFGLKHYVRLG